MCLREVGSNFGYFLLLFLLEVFMYFRLNARPALFNQIYNGKTKQYDHGHG